MYLHELKVIAISWSRYKLSWRKRAVDKRADDLHAVYVCKPRKAEQYHGGTEPGQVRRVEGKLLSYPKVEGLVNGNWGKASEATSRARVAEPQTNRRGINLSEEGLKGMAVSYGGGQG